MKMHPEPAGGQRGPYAVSAASRERIRQALRALQRETGRWPTLDELTARTGLGKTTIRRHVDELAAAHLVKVSAPRREIVLLDGDQGA